MQIEASLRLQASAVTYEQYAQTVEAAFLPADQLQAFSIPSILKGLWGDLKAIATHLKEAGDVGYEHLAKAFKEKSVFALLKGVGFSLKKLLHAIHAAIKIPSKVFGAFLQEIVKDFGSLEAIKKLDVKVRLAKLGDILKRHKAIAHISGLALAGFLIWMFIHSSFTGHPANDLSLVDAVVDCIKGNFDLNDLFTSPQGLHALGCLAFGLATGGAGLAGYGFEHVEAALSWLGKYSGDVFNLMLALFYTGAVKVHDHFQFKQGEGVPKGILSSPTPVQAKTLEVPKFMGEGGRHISTMIQEEPHAGGFKVEVLYRSAYPFLNMQDLEKLKAALLKAYPKMLHNILVRPEPGNVWAITFWPNAGEETLEATAATLVVKHPVERSGRNQDWFNRLGKEEQQAYLTRVPQTKFVHTQLLTQP